LRKNKRRDAQNASELENTSAKLAELEEEHGGEEGVFGENWIKSTKPLSPRV
jgi:hypothetical protein